MVTATKTKSNVITSIQVGRAELLRAVTLCLEFAEGKTTPIHDCVLIKMRDDSSAVVNKTDGSNWVRSKVPLLSVSGAQGQEFAVPAKSLKEFLKRLSVDTITMEFTGVKVRITDGKKVRVELPVQGEAYPDPPTVGDELAQIPASLIGLIQEGALSVDDAPVTDLASALKASVNLVMFQAENGLKASVFSAHGRGFSICEEESVTFEQLNLSRVLSHNIPGGVAAILRKLPEAYGTGASSSYIGKIGNWLCVECGTADFESMTQIFAVTVVGDHSRGIVERAIPPQTIKAVVKVAELLEAIELAKLVDEACTLVVRPRQDIVSVSPRKAAAEDTETRVDAVISGDADLLDQPRIVTVYCDLLIARLRSLRQHGESVVLQVPVNLAKMLLLEPFEEVEGRRLHLMIGMDNRVVEG